MTSTTFLGIMDSKQGLRGQSFALKAPDGAKARPRLKFTFDVIIYQTKALDMKNQ